jgi:hypothetical protein
MSWPDGLLGTHRLSLFGIDVGGRADQLAADIELLVDDPVYLFNDWYAVMALGLSGRHECNQQLVANNRRRTVGTNREVAERVRLALVEGFGSFAAGQPDRALDLLIDLRPVANAVGGSHAQRDIIDLTLIAAAARAAARAGERTLTEDLVAERVARKPSASAAATQLVAANRR